MVLRFESLEGEAGLRHGIGAGRVNVSFTAGAEHGDPVAGRRELLSAVGIDPNKTVAAGQVHGGRIAWVGGGEARAGALARGSALAATDGLLTKTPGVGIMITAADCPPVLLWSARQRAAGLVHCGWRGTAQRIVANAVRELAAAGAAPGEIKAGIGPGIGVCCYEVGDDVISQIPARERGEILQFGRGPRPFLDLARWVERQLVDEGVAAANIERLDLCTSCSVGQFFSHRADRGRCGRFGVAAGVADSNETRI